MKRIHTLDRTPAAILVILGATALFRLPAEATAAPVMFTGTVSYQGSYSGDTLYVAVLDTVGVEDVTLLDVQAIYQPTPPPFNQPYSLTFDNAGVAPQVLIASFLDVDGGGLDDIGGADVFGWYDGDSTPAAVSSAGSQSGLNFSLPRAEIRGMITFFSGQTEARIDVSGDAACIMEGFRPGSFVFGSGPYTVVGIYPGTYCVSAEGSDISGNYRVCHGDPTCASPTLVMLTTAQIATGIDLDFSSIAPVEESSWGRVKSTYR